MSKVKKSLSVMLLLSFLASPSYGAENLTAGTNRFRRSILGLNEVPVIKRSYSQPHVQNQKNSSNAFKLFLAGGVFGIGLGLGLGGKKLYDYLQENEYSLLNDDLDTTCGSIVDEAFTEDKPAPDASSNSKGVMDISYNVEFARFVGVSEEDIGYIKEHFETLIDASRSWVSDDFNELVHPFIDLDDHVEPMPDELKRKLTDEMAITMLLLEFSKYKNANNSNSRKLVFPFTLLRIYRLTNVFAAMKKHHRETFKISAKFDTCPKDYGWYDSSGKFVHPTHNVDFNIGAYEDMKFGVEQWDYEEGGGMFDNSDVEYKYNMYLTANFTHDWRHNIKYQKVNESPGYKFLQDAFYSAKHEIRSDTCDLLAYNPLTLSLLKYVQGFEIDFKQDGVRVLTDDYFGEDKPYIDLL